MRHNLIVAERDMFLGHVERKSEHPDCGLCFSAQLGCSRTCILRSRGPRGVLSKPAKKKKVGFDARYQEAPRYPQDEQPEEGL